MAIIDLRASNLWAILEQQLNAADEHVCALPMRTYIKPVRVITLLQTDTVITSSEAPCPPGSVDIKIPSPNEYVAPQPPPGPGPVMVNPPPPDPYQPVYPDPGPEPEPNPYPESKPESKPETPGEKVWAGTLHSFKVPLQNSLETHYLCMRTGLDNTVRSGAMGRDINTQVEKERAVWKLVSPGLAGEGSVSFESSTNPGHFLQHSGPTPFAEWAVNPRLIKLTAYQDSDAYKRTASFKEVPGLQGPGYVSYELLDNKGFYMWWGLLSGYYALERHGGDLPFGNDNVLTDASFVKQAPIA